MDHALSATTGHRAMRVALFLGSSALVAVALAAMLRASLPYEELRRYTADAQFLMWEGVVWMSGLALILLGGASAFDTMRLGRTEGAVDGALEGLRPRAFRFSAVPWWMMCTGGMLLVLAIQARAGLPG
ncbi:hypothetical protein [Longimicrobium sp.]|uniref:hypothetical protein n=1 Tax=Longimicrobium sp. TaxID=2029185 RepID=UPI002E2EA93F|nr:hypothetical protein [Longimicrobium sp.]HEX6040353.1 hypothetical protein [Longimicrobium sp.]